MNSSAHLRTNLSGFNNEWYRPGKNQFVRLLWYFTNILFFISPLNPLSFLKVFLLRLFGARIGKGVNIKPSVNIKYPWRLTIGDYCWIGENVWIDNLDDIVIGNNCCISQGAMLLCGNHNYRKESFDLIIKPVTLEEGVWIGAHSVVCPGITCKSHAILTVNSTATSNLEAYSIYQGTPAKKIRQRVIEK
jgi:putative colanic acid biosynthesis acetyltransferase WcaF